MCSMLQSGQTSTRRWDLVGVQTETAGELLSVWFHIMMLLLCCCCFYCCYCCVWCLCWCCCRSWQVHASQTVSTRAFPLSEFEAALLVQVRSWTSVINRQSTSMYSAQTSTPKCNH